MKYPSINDALERAEIRAQELPHVAQIAESDWDVVVLANEIKRLRREVDRLTPKKPVERKFVERPTTPITPWPSAPFPTSSQCHKCGLVMEGAMGYVCSVPMCPTGLGGAWCNTKSRYVD